MNLITHEKITRLLRDIIPDSMSDDRTCAIYSEYDADYIISQNYETDAWSVIRKGTEIKLSDAEIEIYVREKSRTHIPIIPGKPHGVKSLHFVQDLGKNVEKLPKEIKLSKEKEIELANSLIQEIRGPISELTDEQLLERVRMLGVELNYCENVLRARNIKIGERNRGVKHVENVQRKLEKREKKLSKEPLTAEQKKMKTMGLDYTSPEDIKKYNDFLVQLKSMGA